MTFYCDLIPTEGSVINFYCWLIAHDIWWTLSSGILVQLESLDMMLNISFDWNFVDGHCLRVVIFAAIWVLFQCEWTDIKELQLRLTLSRCAEGKFTWWTVEMVRCAAYLLTDGVRLLVVLLSVLKIWNRFWKQSESLCDCIDESAGFSTLTTVREDQHKSFSGSLHDDSCPVLNDILLPLNNMLLGVLQQRCVAYVVFTEFACVLAVNCVHECQRNPH